MEGGWKTPPPPCYNETKKPSAYRVKTNLQSKFKEIWRTKTTEMSKLSFYRQHKIVHKFEEYLTLLENS